MTKSFIVFSYIVISGVNTKIFVKLYNDKGSRHISRIIDQVAVNIFYYVGSGLLWSMEAFLDKVSCAHIEDNELQGFYIKAYVIFSIQLVSYDRVLVMLKIINNEAFEFLVMSCANYSLYILVYHRHRALYYTC